MGATSVLASVDECSMQKITICTRYKLADGESNMALLEIGMISGYVPDRTSLHSLLEDPATSEYTVISSLLMEKKDFKVKYYHIIYFYNLFFNKIILI